MSAQYQRTSLLLVIMFSITGCNGFKSQDFSKLFKKAQSIVCYTGNENEVCYPTFAPQDRLSDLTDYKYSNPRNNPDFPVNFDFQQYINPSYFIDLRDISEDDHLSKNFKLNEFMSLRKGALALFSTDVVEYMQTIRDELNTPVFITSGYRNPKYNEAVGGARWSRHQYGDAVDFSTEAKNFAEIKDICLNLGAAFYQIYENHIHCDWRAHPLNEEFYGPVSTPKFNDLTKVLANNSRIVVHEDSSGSLHISADVAGIEDNPEELTYEWLLKIGPNSYFYDTSEFSISRPEKKMQIEVTVGGSIKLKKTWP